MNLSTVVLLVTVYFVLSLLSLYGRCILSLPCGKRQAIRRQRNLTFAGIAMRLLAHMRLEQATRR